MAIKILGMIGVAPSAGTAVHVIGGGIDSGYLEQFTRCHEQAGFDPFNDAIEFGRELIPAIREGARAIAR